MKKKYSILIFLIMIASAIHAGSMSSNIKIAGEGTTIYNDGQYKYENLDKVIEKKWKVDCYETKDNKTNYCVAATNFSYLDVTNNPGPLNKKDATSKGVDATLISINNIKNFQIKEISNETFNQTKVYFLNKVLKEAPNKTKPGKLLTLQNWLSAFVPYAGKQDEEGYYTLNQFEEKKKTSIDTGKTQTPDMRIETQKELLFGIIRLTRKNEELYERTPDEVKLLSGIQGETSIKLKTEEGITDDYTNSIIFNEYDKLTKKNIDNTNFYFELKGKTKTLKLYPLIATSEIKTSSRLTQKDASLDSTGTIKAIGETYYTLRISFILRK